MNKFKQLFVLFLCIFVMAACKKQPSSTADIPRTLSAGYAVTVAPFTQPLNPSQLISGQIPDFQGKISKDELINLDKRLREVLQKGTKRQYEFMQPYSLPEGWDSGISTGQASALERWADYGKKCRTQFLLVPQVINWHERKGSAAGVTNSAAVKEEFYLINLKNGNVVSRSVYEEKQTGLIDNLLTMPEFVKRKGKWVTAAELASDGMAKAVRDLGL